MNLCMQQLMRKRAKPKGGRYSIEKKLICLALYKTSGSAYRFLVDWFHLPCPRTVKRTLHNIPERTGINEFLLMTVSRMVLINPGFIQVYNRTRVFACPDSVHFSQKCYPCGYNVHTFHQKFSAVVSFHVPEYQILQNAA